jgi:GR25 family glycosyltransferase involved in LPS biosynthesis
MVILSISDIKNAYYINLESRTDRKEHIEKELEKIGIQATRFNATKLLDGAIGCTLSHLKCLESAKHLDHLLILEDDVLFLNPDVFIENMNKLLQSGIDWDVILLGGNNVPPYTRIDDYCVKVSKCQTTTAYLVKGSYIPKLTENIKEGLAKLLREPDQRTNYCIDKYWFSLQEKDNWFLITPLTVVQREDYSDIEMKKVNYKNLMVDLDKEYLFKNNIHNIPKIQLERNNLKKMYAEFKLNNQTKSNNLTFNF